MPTAFISYSWDDDFHKEWVRDFATRLRRDGIETILDQWECAPGDQLPAFMERSVRENDFVLIICTPKYKAKYDSRGGGSGYEGDVIQGEVFTKKNHRKFIPILRKGTWEEVAPSALLGSYFIDLRNGAAHHNYEDLLQTLKGQRQKPPGIGIQDSAHTFRWVVVMDGTYDEKMKPQVELIFKHLQELLKDPHLTIERVQQGSIVISLKGSEGGFRRMKELFDCGTVTELAGLKVLQVRRSTKQESLANMADGELIELCSRGELEAWSEFVYRWREVIDLVARDVAKRWGETSWQLTDDLVKEVFSKLYDGLQNFYPRNKDDVFRFVGSATKKAVNDHFISVRRERPRLRTQQGKMNIREIDRILKLKERVFERDKKKS